MPLKQGRSVTVIKGLIVTGNKVPTGTIKPFSGSLSAIPSGWVLCDGSVLNRTIYAELYATVGNSFGHGNGSTTFHTPDLRGRFLRGTSNGTGRDTTAFGRTASNAGGNSGDAVGSLEPSEHYHSHGIPGVQNGTMGTAFYVSAANNYHMFRIGTIGWNSTQYSNTTDFPAVAGGPCSAIWGETSIANINANAGIGDLAAEIRPENVNTWYIIKY